MGLFSKLNARVLAAIDRRANTSPLVQVSASAAGLSLRDAAGRQVDLAWSDVQRVVASRRDLFAGDETILLVETLDGRVVELGSMLPGWTDLCLTLDRLESATPAARWLAQVSAAEPGQSVTVWARAQRPPPRAPS